jgi:putative cell wall-binding protein
LAISGLTVALTASPAAAATTTRIGGANRYDTARLAAEATFPGGAATAVLATGQNFPDALAASTLAGALGAPILLTPTASLAAETVAALATLHVHTVQIVGGPAAVSAAVIAQLTGLGYTVPAAIAGATRYDTAAAIATAAATSAPVGTIGGKKTAIVATGENFPDALAAGSASYSAHFPVILTTTAALSAQASATITSLGITNVLIAGGPAAVSAATETSLKALAGGALTTTRLAGATRFETAVAWATNDIAPVISGGLGMSAANMILASGLNFPDALVGAEFSSPILLTPDTLPPSVATFLGANAAAISKITALGGTAAVSAAALTAAGAATSPSGGTATITAASGNNFFTVSFAQAVNTPTSANFTKNNTALVNTGAPGPDPFVITLGNNTYEVITPGVFFVLGDTVAINAAAPPTATNGNPVASTSVTVGANVPPTITGVQFFSGGTALSVQFSKTVDNGVVAAPAILASIKISGTAQGASTLTLSSDGTTATITNLHGTTPNAGAPAGSIGSGDTLTVVGGVTGAVLDGIHDNLKAPLAASSTTNTSVNAVAPTALAAHVIVTGTTQGTVSPAVPGGDVLVLSAKPGSAADGANGDGTVNAKFRVVEIAPTAGQAGLVVTPTTAGGITTFTVSWPGGVFASGAALAAAFTASAPLNSVLVANGTGSAGAGASTAGAAAGTTYLGATSPGTTSYAVSVAWSKPLVPNGAGGGQDNAGSYLFSNGAGPVLVLPNGQAVPPLVVAQVQADGLTYKATLVGNQLIAGTSTVKITAGAGGIVDFAGNALAPNPTTLTLS